MTYLYIKYSYGTIPVHQARSQGGTHTEVTGKYLCSRHGHGAVVRYITHM